MLTSRPTRSVAALASIAFCSLALATLAAAPGAGTDDDCLRTIAGLDLQTASMLELQSAIADGTVTAEQLTARSLERVAAFDEDLNAVRALAPDALAQARALDAEYASTGVFRGPLHGMTVLLKDNIGTTDLPTTAGSIALEGNVPVAEADVTTRLREAGAIVLGKANLSEFANWVSLSMPNGYSSLGGQVVHPYGFAKDPLGSSTGSAVAGAMAYSAFTIGTETSGSIISPATVNGLVAIKPTQTSVSGDGIIPLAPTFDVAGPMGRTVTDVALVLQVIDQADVDVLGGLSDKALDGARIGVREQDLGTPFFDRALVDLEAQGATIVVLEEPVPTLASGSILEIAAIFNEFKVGINDYLATTANVTTGVQDLADIIAFNSDHPDRVRYGQNLLELSEAQTGLALDPVSVASANAARLASQQWIDHVLQLEGLTAIAAPNFSQVNLAAAAGYPSLTVPAGFDGTDPQGLSLIASAGDDGVLLSLAFDFEQATHHRIPPTQINESIGYCVDVVPADAYLVVAEPDLP